MSGNNPSQRRLARVLLALVVLAALSPVVTSDFGGFDDDLNVARNAHFNPPTLEGLLHYWRRPAHDLYVPLTYTTWWAAAHVAYSPRPDALGRRLDARVFHVLNLVLHVGATLVAFELLRLWVRDTWAAFAGAAVFGLHPLQVEPVAWVAGLKDVQAGVLALGALWQYLRAAEATPMRRRAIGWSIGTAAFVLAMLSKPSAVVVPAMAVVLDHVVTKRPWKSAVVRALPRFALAVPCVVWTTWAQPARAVGEAVALHVRPLIAADALAFYLYKLVWPLRLGVDYGRTPQLAVARGWVAYTWVVPLAVTVLALLARRTAPLLGAALALFVIALLPVLGLVPFDFQAYSTVADHYTYLPMLGPALAAAWLASRLPERGMVGVIVIGSLVLGMLSFRQARTWRDAVTIFEQALRVNPQSWVAENQLAAARSARGDYAAAVEHARRAAALNPHAPTVHIVLALNLAKLGRTEEAIDAYRAALRVVPDDVFANTNLANLLADHKRYDQAIEHYRRAIRADPGGGLARMNLATVYEETGRLAEAEEQYRAALRLDPNMLGARQGLARVLARRDAPSTATAPSLP